MMEQQSAVIFEQSGENANQDKGQEAVSEENFQVQSWDLVSQMAISIAILLFHLVYTVTTKFNPEY